MPDNGTPGLARERAYAFAKGYILDGTFPSGSLVSEGDVATLVGVSRTPVRDAFLRLEVEGLVRLIPSAVLSSFRSLRRRSERSSRPGS